MAWVHDTGHLPAYDHTGYPVSVLLDGTETGSSSARTAAEVGWRSACECGWRGMQFYSRSEWLSSTGSAPTVSTARRPAPPRSPSGIVISIASCLNLSSTTLSGSSLTSRNDSTPPYRQHGSRPVLGTHRGGRRYDLPPGRVASACSYVKRLR